MMGLIGFSVGMLGFLLHQIIDLISEVKWEQTKEYIANGEFSTALMWTFSYSFVFLVVSTLLVVYQPAAAGSGIPEIIGFLNGTRIPDIFKVQSKYTTVKLQYRDRLLIKSTPDQCPLIDVKMTNFHKFRILYEKLSSLKNSGLFF